LTKLIFQLKDLSSPCGDLLFEYLAFHRQGMADAFPVDRHAINLSVYLHVSQLSVRVAFEMQWTPDCTHLVMARIVVTQKIFSALQRACHIVNPAWLEELWLSCTTHFAVPDDKRL
jgi:hypothetical protein